MQRTPVKSTSSDNSATPKRKLSSTSPLYPPQKMPLKENIAVVNMSLNDLSSLLDEKLKNVATKSDLAGICAEIHNLKQNNAALQDKLHQMESKCFDLEQQMNWLAKKAIEKNIILHLPVVTGQIATEKAKSICLDLLKSNDSTAITEIRSLRSNNPKVNNVMVEMKRKDYVDTIVSTSFAPMSKLRDEGISLHRDYPAAAREKRRRLVNIRKQVLAKNNKIKTQIRGEKITINNHIFNLDAKNNLTCEDEDGMTFLRHLIGDSSTLTAEASGSQTAGNVQKPSF